MEDRQYDPNEEQAKPTEAAEKKRRYGNFLSEFLARRRNTALETTESDNDEEEDSEDKPKRWSRKFRSFFRNVVTPPEDVTDQPKKESVEWFKWPLAQETTVPETVQSASEGVEAAQLTPDVSAEAVIPADDVRSEMPAVAETIELPEPSEHDRSAQRLTPESTRPVAAPAERDTEESRPDQPETDSANPGYNGLLTIQHEERARQEAEPEIVRETVVERGAGSALPVVLVAAEYLARKSADKKITRNFTDKTDKLQKNAEQANITQQQLERLVKQNREQLEALKQERGMIEKSGIMPTTEKSPSVPERLSPRPEVKTTVPRVEQMSPRASQERIMPQQQQRTPETTEPKPREILSEVAQAAERNVPVERVFERSHEVKDDNTVAPAAAASVGSIMSRQTMRQSSHVLSKDYQQASRESANLPIINDQYSTGLYKQAMKAGFTAAIMIIIFGILAYLMVK